MSPSRANLPKKNTLGNLDIALNFNDLFNEVSIGLIIFSQDGKIIHANCEACQMFGYNEDMALQTFETLFFDEPYSTIRTLIKDLENEHPPKNQHVIRLKHAENRSLWGIVSFSKLSAENKNQHILCQLKNISELKIAEEKITYQSHMLFELVNSLPDNIYIKDAESRFILANKRVSMVMGADNPKDLIGKTDFDFHRKKLAQKYYRDEQEIINTGKSKINIIEQVVDSDNNRRWYSTSKVPFKDSRGSIIGIMGIGRDITDSIKEQKNLRKAKRAAEKADSLKTAFLANLSHEIRTPLNGIIGFSQFLHQSELSDEKRTKYLDIIVNNGKHLLNIINDIIDISKIDTGELVINIKQFMISEFMTQIKYLVIEKMQQMNKVHLSLNLVNCNTEVKETIMTDDLRLKQILLILLSNAIKFTQFGGIEFGYEKVAEGIKFFVRDTGIGIAEENQTTIFERFRQGDNSLTRQYGGNGLGLSIAKGLIHLLGGNIVVKSEVSKRTEFFFILPDEHAGIIDPQKETKSDDLADIKIVVLDTDDNSFDYLEVVLLQHGVEIIRANNENEFQKLIFTDRLIPKLIIFSPDRSWIKDSESIKNIRNILHQTALLMIISKDNKNRLEDYKAEGITDFIYEPVREEKLFAAIKRLVLKSKK